MKNKIVRILPGAVGVKPQHVGCMARVQVVGICAYTKTVFVSNPDTGVFDNKGYFLLEDEYELAVTPARKALEDLRARLGG